ncbi:MAG: HAD-IC family P-type ATPase [Patescibacteria group bacterium]
MKSAELETKSQTNGEIVWHSFPLGDVFLHLDSKRDGLSRVEAEKRLKHFGHNEPEPQKKKPAVKILWRQFLNPFILILVAAGVLTLFVKSFLDAVVIFTVVILNGFMVFFQEYQTEKSLKSLSKLEVRNAVVSRDGAYAVVPADTVVPGDIVAVRAGDKVPADARLIHSFGLRTDESILTGESREVLKWVAGVDASKPVFERTNIIFGGTLVTDGSGEAVVFGTGGSSEIGRISRLLKDPPLGETPFEKKISKLGRLVGFVVVILSALILIGGILSGRNSPEMFLVAAAIAVAAIPEGLPAAITVILVMGLGRILKEKGLVRSLSAAENLGSTSVILTDKTGTLTQGKMRVAKILTPERRGGILEMGAAMEHESNHMLILSYGLLVSEAWVENPGDEVHKWKTIGGPVDQALLLAALEAGLDLKKINRKFKKLGQILFNSSRKYGISFREDETGSVWAIVIGMPDMLLAHIKKIQILNRYENAIPFELATIKESADGLAKSGFKVLAVCSKKIEDKTIIQKHISSGIFNEALAGLNLVGLVGLKDPVRPDVKDFLSLARRAGIRTVMVTGDHSFTARLVAKEAGLVALNKNLPLELAEGKDIASLDVKELSHRVRAVDIFSRVTPEQKLKITEAWQLAGETVAVVGDGVNDAPALKEADIGVSLSRAVDLAKEASDMVLLESSFSVLVKAIKEGRVILDNLKKVVVYLLSTGLTEIILMGLSLFFGLPLPLGVVQILWINLVHEGLPALALAVDPAEKYVMDDPPPDVNRPILDNLTRFLIAVVGSVSAMVLFLMFLFFRSSSDGLAYTQTVVFVGLGVLALFFSFSMRNLKRPLWEIPFFENRYLLGSLVLGLVFLAAAVYWPPLQFLLHSQPIGFWEWVIIFGVGLINVILIEIAKWAFTRRLRHSIFNK